MLISDSITAIKGVGEKTAQAFNKIGIYTISDLISTYPRNYLLYEEPIMIKEATEGDRVAVFAQIVSTVDVRKVRNLTIISTAIRDESGSLRAVWYNSPFLKNVFRKGDSYVFVGTIRYKNGQRVIEMPEYYTEQKYEAMTKVLQPVYPITAGLTNNTFRKSIQSVSDIINQADDYLPGSILNEYNLMPRFQALQNMHFPLDMDRLKEAQGRMAFDEFLMFLLEMRKMKTDNLKVLNSHVLSDEAKNKLDIFVRNLPYQLTKGQSEAVKDMVSDMSSDNVMNRLVQGDVGSGKTIVAACGLYANAISGYQGALMVPTEVLAMQHYKDFKEMLEPYGMRIGLLTGSLPIKEKRSIYEMLKAGDIDIIIGTHAIIQDKTEFKNLGLVVTDEQHRFGVKQRQKLSEKGLAPHTLIMSATPIPRTLAIILYADLDISVIKELPQGRKAIKNCVVDTSYRPTAYNFIKNQVLSGHQAYVICPMVEDSEAVEAENVIDYSNMLKDALGQGIEVAYLHGRMSEAEKNEVLDAFINRRVKVLVSTTVVEVGINNPNATVMMIENAERFGLAQLHQLRGRVGRGDAQSYCIFINAKKSKDSEERLRVLENSNDGFFIAGEDLKLRGPGDFFGIRQSGDIMFRFGDIYKHTDMLRLAQEVSIKYGDSIKVKLDYTLPMNTL